MALVKGSIVPSAVGYEAAKTQAKTMPQDCGETGSPASTDPQPSLSVILASGSGFLCTTPETRPAAQSCDFVDDSPSEKSDDAQNAA